MRKVKVQICITIMFSIIISMISSQPFFAADDKNILGYSIDYNSEEWQTMTLQEKIDACEIDGRVLADCSTEQLVELALDYPLAGDMFLFDSPNDAMNHLARTSSVYNELLHRSDLHSNLIEAFKKLDDKEGILLKKMELKLLLQYCEEKTDKDDEVLQSFVKESDDHKIKKVNISDSEGLTNKGLRAITQDGFSWNWFYAYFNEGAKYYSGTYTKYGKTVTCYKYRSGDYTDEEKAELDAYTHNAHSNWSKWASATKSYNCHSYAWINPSSSNLFWLNNPTEFATSTSYFMANSANSSLYVNQRVIIYGLNDQNQTAPMHSVRVLTASSGSSMTGIMATSNVVSKLGCAGLYMTTMNDMYILYDGIYYLPYTPL